MNRNQAMVFKVGIEAGIVDREEIIEWADGILASDEPYIDCIADLATCQEKPYSEIFSLLGEVPGPVPTPQAFWSEFKEFLKKKIKEKRIEPKQAVSLLYWHYRDGILPRTVEDKIQEFEMDYDCVAEGYGDLLEVNREVESFFNAQPEPVDSGNG